MYFTDLFDAKNRWKSKLKKKHMLTINKIIFKFIYITIHIHPNSFTMIRNSVISSKKIEQIRAAFSIDYA